MADIRIRHAGRAFGREVVEITEELSNLVDMSQAMLPEEMGRFVYAQWVSLAQQRLTSSRDVYLRALSEPEVHGGRVRITLSDAESPLPLWVEEGVEGFDLKAAMASRGERIIIPFEHAGPGSKGGMPLGLGYRRALGRAAAGAIGRKLHEVMSKYTGKRLRKMVARIGPQLPQHQRPIYAGMQRSGRKNAPGGVQYTTFRSMSQNSTGWIHPGIEARHLAEDAVASLDEAIDEMVESMVDAAFGSSGSAGATASVRIEMARQGTAMGIMANWQRMQREKDEGKGGKGSGQ